jgi:hypothetical protein
MYSGAKARTAAETPTTIFARAGAVDAAPALPGEPLGVAVLELPVLAEQAARANMSTMPTMPVPRRFLFISVLTASVPT